MSYTSSSALSAVVRLYPSLDLGMNEASAFLLQMGQPQPPDSPQASMLFNLLPSAIKTLIPHVPSIRRTISACRLRRLYSTSALPHQRLSECLEDSFVEEGSLASTPGLSRPSSSKSSKPATPANEAACAMVPSRELRYATNGMSE